MVAAKDNLDGNQRFKFVETLGQGDRTVLLKAWDTKTKRHVAIKCFPKDLGSEDQMKLFRATIIQQYANHPCLAKLVEISREKMHICVATEYVEGPNLKQFVEQQSTQTDHPTAQLRYLTEHKSDWRSICKLGLTEEMARKLFCDVVQGIRYLHEKDVCYQLAVAEYIVVTKEDTRAKLVNFLSRFGASLSTNKTMPLPYLAPETWILPPDSRSIQFNGQFTDVWSLGVLLFFMLFSEFPFEAESKDAVHMAEELKQKVTMTDLRFEEGEISEECRILITRMLKRNLEDRITLEGIMNTNWFRDGVQELPIEPPEQNMKSPEDVRRIIDGYDD